MRDHFRNVSKLPERSQIYNGHRLKGRKGNDMRKTLFAPQLNKFITCSPIGEMDDGYKVWERDNEIEYQFSCMKTEKGFQFFIMSEK